jgi:hypothetical protein
MVNEGLKPIEGEEVLSEFTNIEMIKSGEMSLFHPCFEFRGNLYICYA